MYTVKIVVLVAFLLAGVELEAQTFCLQMTQISNNGSKYVVELRLQASAAFDLSSSNFEFDFNSNGLTNPVFKTTTLSSPFYTVTASSPGSGIASLNVVLNISGFGDEMSISPNWSPLGQIEFDITDPNQSTGFLWRYNGGTTQTVVFKDASPVPIQIVATENNSTCLAGFSNPLPIELLEFKTTSFSNSILLAWLTASERNFSGFKVQRSLDLAQFQDITFVPAQGGNLQQTYNYTDNNVRPNTTYYYRLKMLDNDGQFEYSPVRSARIEGDEHIRVFPNPADTELNIEMFAEKEGDATMKIWNNAGNIMHEQTWELLEGNNPFSIEIANWPEGVYFIQIKTGEGTLTEKFLKTN